MLKNSRGSWGRKLGVARSLKDLQMCVAADPGACPHFRRGSRLFSSRCCPSHNRDILRSTNGFPTAAFLNLSRITILPRILLCHRDCPLHLECPASLSMSQQPTSCSVVMNKSISKHYQLYWGRYKVINSLGVQPL